jgi:hypothetical protein
MAVMKPMTVTASFTLSGFPARLVGPLLTDMYYSFLRVVMPLV